MKDVVCVDVSHGVTASAESRCHKCLQPRAALTSPSSTTTPSILSAQIPHPHIQTSLSLSTLCIQMSFVDYFPFFPDVVDAYLSPLVSEESPISAAPETPPLDMDLVDFAQFQANPVSANSEL